MITCLICLKEFKFLPTHLRKAHGVSVAEYREAYNIAQGEPLASDDYRRAHAEKMRRMQSDGRINYEHLGDAVEASRGAKNRPKRGAARKKQIEVICNSRPWEYSQLPPGAKRADGQDADRARIYQREYRRKKKSA